MYLLRLHFFSVTGEFYNYDNANDSTGYLPVSVVLQYSDSKIHVYL